MKGKQKIVKQAVVEGLCPSRLLKASTERTAEILESVVQSVLNDNNINDDESSKCAIKIIK